MRYGAFQRALPSLIPGLLLGLLSSAVPGRASPTTHSGAGKLPDRLRAYLEVGPADRHRLILENEEGLVPVTITFHAEPDALTLSNFEDAGVHFSWSSKGPVHYGPVYPARCTADGLRHLDYAPEAAAVSARPAFKPLPMLDVTRVEIGAETAWYHAAGPAWPLSGSGVTVADVDTGIDLFHPLFFRADGGTWAWTDVNGDWAFTPGVDGVDFNGDGLVGGDEVLQLIDAAAFRLDLYETRFVPGAGYDGRYTAGFDWLYLDLNGNGSRDYGYDPGDPVFPVDESTPAYGEPIFLADDVNGSGTLEVEEKLVRLGTSKIRAILTGPGFNEYRRGENLVQYPGADAWEMEHATQALSIVAGGNPGLTRYTGVAPGADLVLAVYTELDYVECLAWALAESPDVVLHEAGTWIDVFLDGSSEEERIMDDSTAAEGVIHINPVGNLGGSSKHAFVTAAASGVTDLALEVPDMSWYYPLYGAFMSFLWRTPSVNLRFEMCSPSGRCDDFTDAGMGGIMIWDGTMYVFSYGDVSDRGTRKLTAMFGDFYEYRDPLPVGTWRLRIHNASSSAVPLHLYVMDDMFDWTLGAYWDGRYATDLYTVTHPGTADSSLNVAAYAGHGEDWGDPDPRGSLRWYSSQGPRIDETPNVDVAAPDNPVTASPPVLSEMERWSYMEFSGTSGAGPHAAGGAALILEADPELAGLGMRGALRESALADSYVGDAPNDQWGWGKLRIAPVIFGSEPPADLAPTLTLLAPDTVMPGETFSVAPEAHDPDGDPAALVMRWDLDYDGAWDTDWAAVEPRSMVFDAPRIVFVKAQVRDDFGHEASAAVRIIVVDPSDPPPERPPEPVDDAPDLPDLPGEWEPEGPGPDAGSSIMAVPAGCGCCIVLPGAVGEVRMEGQSSAQVI